MKTNRRKFIAATFAGGLAATLPLPSFASPATEPLKAGYSKLDEVLKKTVLKKELFSSPVIIEKLELLRFKNNFLCRVRSKDGAEEHEPS